MSQIVRFPMTPQGHERIKKEIDYLKSVERPKVIRELEEARAHGDLSENAEYHAARERLGHVNGRLQDLENRLSKAEVIDPKLSQEKERVTFGVHITLLDLDNEIEVTYQIVGEYECDINCGQISITSPIARSAVGKRKNDVIKVTTPKGARAFEIIGIEYK